MRTISNKMKRDRGCDLFSISGAELASYTSMEKVKGRKRVLSLHDTRRYARAHIDRERVASMRGHVTTSTYTRISKKELCYAK